MSFDDNDYYEDERDTIYAIGSSLCGILPCGTSFEVSWKAPLTWIDTSFDHAFGTERQESLGPDSNLTADSIELTEFYLESPNGNIVHMTVDLERQLREVCLEAYFEGKYWEQ